VQPGEADAAVLRVSATAGTGSEAAKGASMGRRLLIAMAIVTASAALAGCGRDGDRAQVRAVTDRFFAALHDGDEQAACAQLSTDTRSELESQEGKPCRQAIGSVGLQPARVTRVQVFITNAKADLGSGESLFLDQGPDGWELSALGCKPEGGKPADRPYDCELQA
jgi:hypothetical protein